MKDSLNESHNFSSSFAGEDPVALRDEKLASDSPARARMTATQRRKLLFHWNMTRREYPRDRCLHHLFEEQVDKTPRATAVQDDADSLSYRELNRRANRLAHQLRSLGVQRETLVGVCLEPSTDLLVALLAVMKAGGAYVPLDASYPRERIAFMVHDSAMPLIITRDKLKSILPHAEVRILSLETPLPEAEFSPNPASELTPENLAYVIYTSGSTGRPKGVMMTHRGLVNYLVWATQAYEMKKGTGAPVHSSIAFDLTITGLFAPLLAGGSVRMLPQNLETLGLALRADTPFSLVKITPAHLELLCAQWTSECGASTHLFVVGGEALFGQSLDFWQRCAPAAALVNEYGPTETAVGCCAYFVPKSHMFDGAIPIGRPIANTQLYVLDESLEPAPLGESGELYIAGDGLARGYLNLPELTAEKFVPNPFAAEDENTSARMYKTGDLVRYLPDGNLEFLGRADDQIKLRGYLIEPAEIEAALVTHPQVRNAAVISLTSASGEKYLAAYLLAKGPPPAPADLREHLKARLPEPMIPSVYVTLAALPLTANGKVDRKALPLPELKVDQSEMAANETEHRVAELWSEALQRPVELDDNFFELGGHSLLAVRLVMQINQLFETQLDALSFYQHTTPRQVAQLVEGGGETVPPKLVRLRPGRGEGPIVFLNAPQELIRVANLMTDQHAIYVSEVPFPKGAVEAAMRSDTTKLPGLEEMISPHFDLICSHQLSDPIFLAGYSSYGMVAFEVAHLLRRAGKKVGGVFLFDADMKPSRWAVLRVRSLRHARELMKSGAPYLWKKMRDRTRQKAEGTACPTADDEISWRIFQCIWDHVQRNYSPQILDTPGVLFRAKTTIYGDIHDHDGCLGWRGLFSEGLEVVEVPGGHLSIWVEPHIHALTRAWQDSLGQLACLST
ncbi:MAG: amino acid adenylation domain-containing protein [Verrucomicrobiota bacterium]|nr:amino acid adenylation domain-containing protein [Verrucomicrobiota bacterium]